VLTVMNVVVDCNSNWWSDCAAVQWVDGW